MFAAAAIKTGRYTHEKKTRDIQEVKRLQQLQLMQQHQDHQDYHHCHQYTNHLNSDSTLTDADTAFGDTSLNDEQEFSAPVELSSELSEMTSLMKGDMGSAMDHFIVKITRLHEQQTPHTPEFFDRLPAKENEYVVSLILITFNYYINLTVQIGFCRL